MTLTKKQQHISAIVLLTITAIVWGSGFLCADKLLANGFADIPLTLNTLRFALGAVILLAVFAPKLRMSKQMLLYSAIGGVLLFAGFTLQVEGLRFTTPASCGFFTAAYTVFVPFIAWIAYKKRPSWLKLIGVAVALAGLAVLNIGSMSQMIDKELLLGNMLTFMGSMCFGVQIVLSDYALQKKHLDSTNFTVWQIVICAVITAMSSFIFESRHYAGLNIDWSKCWWLLLLIGALGTAFAYFSQTYSQQLLSPTETSVILACESPIGAIVSVSFGADKLTWQICLGGFLVLVAVIIIEVLPHVIRKKQPEVSATEEDVPPADAAEDVPYTEMPQECDTPQNDE